MEGPSNLEAQEWLRPAFGGLLRDLHRRHEVTEDVSRCQEVFKNASETILIFDINF